MADAKPLEIRGIGRLSKKAATFLRRHPNQARRAVTAALEAVAASYEQEAGADDIPERLRPFVVERDDDGTIINASQAADNLKVSRTTVYQWVRKGVLLGWTATRRGTNIPSEQILGAGKVVPGIPEVLEVIDDPELAWTFLSSEWPFADEVCRPIDKLKEGKVEEVVDAAPSFGTAVT